MQLAIAIVSALVSIAGMGLKLWLNSKTLKAAQAEVAKWAELTRAATKENIKLRSLLAKKEVALAAAQSALTSKMSASELAVALTELFGGKPPGPGPASPPGNPPPTAG